MSYNSRRSLVVLRELTTPVPDLILDLVSLNPKSDSIDISWTQPNLNGTTFQYYEIQQKKCSDAAFVTIATSTTETYTAVNLDSEECYEYRVKTVSVEGAASYGNITQNETTPDIPLFQNDYAFIATSDIDTVDIVALEDTVITRNGVTVATLTAGQSTQITGSQFDVFIGTGAFAPMGLLGSNNYALTPNYAVGKLFSAGFIRRNPQTVSVYALQDSNVTVTNGGAIVSTQFIPANTGFNFVFNSTNVTVLVESDGLIMGSIQSNPNGTVSYDQRLLLPASKNMVGWSSSRAVVYPVIGQTHGGMYRANGTSMGGFAFHGTNERWQSANTGSQYAGNSSTVRANNPVSVASFANSNGVKQAAWIGTEYMTTHFGTSLQQDWIAFCNDGAPFSISTSNGNIYNSTGSSEAQYVYINAAADRVPSTLFTSTEKVAGFHQSTLNDDESILFGWNI